jgi:acetyl-CoA carboxylase carboxyl transferase subunit alpha
MLQYSIYSVISPEGCAAILWKSAAKAADAAEILGITSHRLKSLGLIDRIVNEPVGGAHRDPEQMGVLLKRALSDALRQAQSTPIDQLLDERHRRILAYGKFKATQ